MDDDYGEINDFFGNDYSDNERATDENDAGSADQLNKLLEKEKEQVIKKRAKSRPQPKLDEARITGPSGIQALRDSFKNFHADLKKDPFDAQHFKYDNLAAVLKKYEHWAHVMFPKLKFEDVVGRCELLGDKRAVKVYMMKSRLGMPLTDDDFAPARRRKDEIIETENNEDDIRIRDRDESDDDKNYCYPLIPSHSSEKSVAKMEKSGPVPAATGSLNTPAFEEPGDDLMDAADEARRGFEEEQRRRELRELSLADEIMDDFDMF